MTAPPTLAERPFFGWRVMWAAFALAAFGWALGFYSPPIFLHAVIERTGWALDDVSLAITIHFLSGALVVANFPRLVGTIGTWRVVVIGVVSVAIGMVGWSQAATLWQLYAAAIFTGMGWVTMSGAGINAILAPWFERRRPIALSMAYNGAGLGGAIIAPIWAFLIPAFGFGFSALGIGLVSVIAVWWLAATYFASTPQSLGQSIDGEAVADPPVGPVPQPVSSIPTPPRPSLFRQGAFLTLAAGMALGLFAQLGIVSHLFSMLVPTLGLQTTGIVMGVATALSVAGRMAVAAMIRPGADRRVWAAVSYAVQLVSSVLFVVYADSSATIAVAAALLFGLGIGNVTSLPPLIAQAEFTRAEILRVVSLVIAIGQATSAFAATLFGFAREWAVTLSPDYFGVALNPEFAVMFALAIIVQLGAILSFLGGRGLARSANLASASSSP